MEVGKIPRNNSFVKSVNYGYMQVVLVLPRMNTYKQMKATILFTAKSFYVEPVVNENVYPC